MRVALLVAWLCLLCGCEGCQQPPAIVADVHYSGFRPDCVVVQAAGTERDVTLGRSAPRDGHVSVAVWPPAGGGGSTDVVAEARIGSCTGPVGAGASELAVAWPSSGAHPVPLELQAQDGDDDGFLAGSGPPELRDCDDGDPDVFPRDGGELLCDGKDEDCRGGADDTFQVGVPCSPGGGCSGSVACAPGGPSQSTVCQALPVLEYWEDVDGDGFGGADAGTSCSPDAGWVRVKGDCDDFRWWINPDAGELCDQLDDDCNGVADDDLGGQRCDRVMVPGLISNPSSGPRLAMAGVGRVVVVGGDGGVAYVEGDGGVLWRGGVCPGNWYGAWVNPANDRVFLGGTTGSLGSLDRTGGGCTSQTSGNGYVFSLWGLPDGGPSPLINFTNTASDYRTWELPGTLTSYGVQINPCCGNLRSLDGRPTGAMMTAGWLYDGVQRHARVLRSPGQGQPFVDTRVEDVLVDAGFATTQAALHEVSFPRDDLAYAVGESSMFLQWDGGAWTLLPPVNDIRSMINSVVAFDEQNVYLATGNFILRWDGAAYSVVVFSPNTSFTQIRGSGPDDLWAVANGQVWHFSARP